MAPQAILFDLDETLIDRTQSIMCYVERLQRDFVDRLVPTTAPIIAATIIAADERGYRPREEFFRDLVQHLPWQTPPEVLHLHGHWETWFPASSVAREGLRETLASLHAQGIRLGVITNGAVQRQQPKIEHLGLYPLSGLPTPAAVSRLGLTWPKWAVYCQSGAVDTCGRQGQYRRH
jgi:putative hydrolase of the HAD superfamily